MLLQLLLSLVVFQQTFADVCEVCGSGLVVTNSAALVEIFGQGSYPTCTELQQAGLNGHIPKAQCDTAPLLIFEVCRCAPTISLSSPALDPRQLNVLARVSFPTPPPASSAATPIAPASSEQVTAAPTKTNSSTIPTPTALESSTPPATQSSACYICGEEGSEVSLPNAIIDITGQPMTCSELEILALEGGISPEECPFLPVVSFLTCGCSSPTSSPPAPSSVPVAAAPSAAPFSTPVDAFPNLSPSSTPVDSTPSPVFTPVNSTPSPAPISTPVDSTSSQPALFPTPVGSTPSPSAPWATSAPNGSVVSECSDGSGSFGDTTGSETEVEFLYEAITTPETVASALSNILTTTIEPALGAGLISGIFSSVCSRRLQWRRRLEVIGLSIKPNDELVGSASCLSDANGNRCTVIRGLFILFSEDGTDVEDAINDALKRIQESMANGAFNNLDPRLPSVNFRTADVADVPVSNTTTAGNPASTASSAPSVPIWTWVLIGVGIALFNCLICFVCCRRRRERKGLDGDEDDDDYGDSSGDQGKPDAAGYREQADNDDDFEDNDAQEGAEESGGFYRPSIAGYGQRVGSDAHETMQMMNSIGNL